MVSVVPRGVGEDGGMAAWQTPADGEKYVHEDKLNLNNERAAEMVKQSSAHRNGQWALLAKSDFDERMI